MIYNKKLVEKINQYDPRITQVIEINEDVQDLVLVSDQPTGEVLATVRKAFAWYSKEVHGAAPLTYRKVTIDEIHGPIHEYYFPQVLVHTQ